MLYVNKINNDNNNNSNNKTKIKGKIAKCMLNVNKQTNRYGMSNEINR